jgi:hypothetical protein
MTNLCPCCGGRMIIISSRGSNQARLHTTGQARRRQPSGSTPHDPITANQPVLPDLFLLGRRPPLPSSHSYAQFPAICTRNHPAQPTARSFAPTCSLTALQNHPCTLRFLSLPLPLACPNPHSLFAAPLSRGAAFPIPPDAISCLGAFRTPVTEPGVSSVFAGVRKPAHNPTYQFASIRFECRPDLLHHNRSNPPLFTLFAVIIDMLPWGRPRGRRGAPVWRSPWLGP